MDLFSFLMDDPRVNKPLLSVWTDVRLDEDTKKLFIRGVQYGPAPDRERPILFHYRKPVEADLLTGLLTSAEDKSAVDEMVRNGFDVDTILANREWESWQEVIDTEVLILWDQHVRRFDDSKERAKAFLKEMNVRTYHALREVLQQLSEWEGEDRERLSKIDELFHTYDEPFYVRELKRNAFKQGQDAIMKLLGDLGFDAEAEVKKPLSSLFDFEDTHVADGFAMGDIEQKRLHDLLGIDPLPVPQSIGDARNEVLFHIRILEKLVPNIKRNWNLSEKEIDDISSFLLKVGADGLLLLKGIIVKDPSFPRESNTFESVFGFSMQELSQSLSDQTQVDIIRARQVAMQNWKMINLRSIVSTNAVTETETHTPVAGEMQKLNQTRRSRFEERFLRRDELYKLAWQMEKKAGSNLSATAALKEAQRGSDGKIIPAMEFIDEFDSILQGYYYFKKRQTSNLPK